MTDEAATSMRLCAGCRATDDREALLRLAISPERPYLVPDPRHRLGGRGVSVHPRRACLELAARRGGFARALRRQVEIDAGALADAAAALYLRRAESLVLSAQRQGALAVGTDATRAALREGALVLLVVAADAEGRRDELTEAAGRLGRRVCVMGSKVSLGRLLGRDEVAVLGVTDAGLAEQIAISAARAAELGVGTGRAEQSSEAE